MARTKQTARRIPVEKGPASQSNLQATPGKNLKSMRAHARAKRFESYRSVLNELRRIQRHMQAAIPRVPFQRVVRGICEEYGLSVRWAPSAIGCLQEALEDWLVEFFADSYIFAAHAHRVTVMPKDINSLRIVRYRYDRLLHPLPLEDRKMGSILHIPPIDKVHIRDVTHEAPHNRDTRLNEERRTFGERKSSTNEAECSRRPPAASRPSREEEILSMHAANVQALQFLGPQMDVRLIVRQEEQYFHLNSEEFEILCNPEREVSDRVMLPVLSLIISKLEWEHQLKVYLLDSLLSGLLSSPTHSFIDVCPWLSCVNFEEVRIIFMAYHESLHWSLLLYDLESKNCYLANSSHGYHGEVRQSARKLISAIEAATQYEYLEETKIITCRVPKQDDAHSCGWRVSYNAEMIIKKILRIPHDMNQNYSDEDVFMHREIVVDNLIFSAAERAPNVPLAFVPPQARRPPRPEPSQTHHPVHPQRDFINVDSDNEPVGFVPAPTEASVPAPTATATEENTQQAEGEGTLPQ